LVDYVRSAGLFGARAESSRLTVDSTHGRSAIIDP